MLLVKQSAHGRGVRALICVFFLMQHSFRFQHPYLHTDLQDYFIFVSTRDRLIVVYLHSVTII